MRRAARLDRNQPEIVEALRNAGCTVQSLAAVGCGVTDLLVGKPTKMVACGMDAPFVATRDLILMEIKDWAKPPSARKLTEDQVKWHAEWAGAPLVVVETVEQALEAIR